MKKQKNLRLDDYTIERIESLAKDFDLPENKIIQLAALMMDLVMNDDGDEKFDNITVKELRRNFIKRIKIIHGEE